MNYNGYHFTSDRLRDGRPVPKIGETLTHEGEIVWCESGLYASPTAWDAVPYAPGEWLHRVLCEDIEWQEVDKFVFRKRTIVATIDATDLLREFARKCALDVIHLWDAPQVVVDYLTTGDESLRKAAWDAAWDAPNARAALTAWDAWDAAWAAWSARDAAGAARDAARAALDAAGAAAGTALVAAWEAQKTRFNDMVDAAFLEASR